MDIGLFALHVTVGLLFVGHGAQKLFGAFGGEGVAGTARRFESLGLRPGERTAVAAGVAELVGGALLALGLLVPLGAALVIAVMVTAVLTLHPPKGLWATEGEPLGRPRSNPGLALGADRYEYNLLIVAVAFALAAVGPGDVSLDAALGVDLAGAEWAFAALACGIFGGLGAVNLGRERQPRHPDDRIRARPA
jgi:putative oxidoreductase